MIVTSQPGGPNTASSLVPTRKLDALLQRAQAADPNFVIHDTLDTPIQSPTQAFGGAPLTVEPEPFYDSQEVVYTDPVSREETIGRYGGKDEYDNAIIYPHEGEQRITASASHLRAVDSNASALDAIDQKYERYTSPIQEEIKRLQDIGAPINEMYAQTSRLEEFMDSLKEDKAQYEQENTQLDTTPSAEEENKEVVKAVEQGRNPVEIYVEKGLRVDPTDTERFQKAIIDVGTNPNLKQGFINWATDNKALSKILEYSKAQEALHGKVPEMFKGSEPIANLKRLSDNLGKLTPAEIRLIPEILEGSAEYVASDLDDFANEWENGTVIILDTETTGLDDKASIVQIGAVKYTKGSEPEYFSVFIKTKEAFNSDGTVKGEDVHRIDKHLLHREGVSPAEGFKAFNTFISGATSYVAHNVDFDTRMLQHNFNKEGVSYDLATINTELDSVVLARASFYKYSSNRKTVKQSSLIKDLQVEVDITGLSADAANNHRADYDARALLGILHKLYESHVNSKNTKATLEPSREQLLQTVAKDLISLYPNTNPMLAVKDLLYADKQANGSLGITKKPLISTSNKASTLFNFDASSTKVDSYLMAMMANVADAEGVKEVIASVVASSDVDVNIAGTLFALAQQYNASQITVDMERSVADAMLLAVFSEGVESYGSEVSLDEQQGLAQAQLYRDSEQAKVNNARRNIIIGEKVQKLLGIPKTKDDVAAALGAIALTAVAGALHVNDKGEGSFGAKGVLTPTGRVFGYELAPLANALLNIKNDKDHYRSSPINKKDWDSKQRYKNVERLKGSAPEDVFQHVYDKLGHDPQWQRDALFELSNMAFRWDYDLLMNIDELLPSEGFNGLLNIKGYTDEQGNEYKGTFQNGRNKFIDALDDNGSIIPKRKGEQAKHNALLNKQNKGSTLSSIEQKEFWETKKHLYDPNSTDPSVSRPNVQEVYHGDNLKDMGVQRLMSMIVPKDTNGNWKIDTKGDQVVFGSKFYTDWFFGLNGRAYMKQYIGNFQSSKLSRGALSSADNATYNSPVEVKLLKAGIMKKFGGKYSKMGVDEAAEAFDEPDHGLLWESLMYSDSTTAKQNWQANADKILEIANDQEKFLSLSAMREGARLLRKYGARDNTGQRDTSSSKIEGKVKSRFFTEVDGVANGTAHNAMQAGSFEAAAATNLNPLIALNSELFEHKKGREGEDIYHLSGEALKQMIEQNGDPILIDLFKKLNLNDKRRDFMKKPVMIFAYGAGEVTIKKSVREGMEELLDQEGVRSTVTEALDAYVDTGALQLKSNVSPMEWLIDQIGTNVNKAVATKFDSITKITKLLSKLATAAVEQGITPSLQMPNGNVIVFGMQYTKARNITFSAKDVREAERRERNALTTLTNAKASKASPAKIGEAQAVYDMARATVAKFKSKQDLFDAPLHVIDSSWMTDARVLRRPSGKEYQIDPEFYEAYHRGTTEERAEVEGAILKAATQAAVLITHHLDATNMLQGIMNARSKGNVGSAAQVFDGIFMTPKDAKPYADALNKEFFRLHNEFFYLDQFKSDLESLIEGRDGSQFDKHRISGFRKMLKDIEDATIAHKRLLRHFEFGDRFIKQFFWDGADESDIKAVESALAKAKATKKHLYSLKESSFEEGRLRGDQEKVNFEQNFFDQFIDTQANPYLADIDERLKVTNR